jgi:gluconokinase
MIIVIAGVIGAGKTTVGRELAARLGWLFLDADDFHSAGNWQKLKRGEPLSDEDRRPWLQLLRKELVRLLAQNKSAVLACSALRQSYRKQLAPQDNQSEDIRFVYLRADPAVIAARLAKRTGHAASPSLLESQLAVLEEPVDAITLDAGAPPPMLVDSIIVACGLERFRRTRADDH